MPKQTFFNLTKEKQDQIINSAISEFSQFSFKEVKISNIVNQARIPRSSFYDYFENKKDLYKYIILIIKEEKMKFMSPLMEKEQDGFFNKFREAFKAGAQFASMRPEYEKLGRKMHEDIEFLNDILGVKAIDTSSFYEDMLIKGIESGELRSDIDVKFIAKSMHILSFNLMTEGLEGEQEALDEFIEEMTGKLIDFIKSGISK